MNTATSEPVAIGGGLTAIAVAAIPALRQFGVEITQDQSDALMALLTAMIAFGTLIVRSKVTTTAKAERAIDTALNIDPNAPAAPPTPTAILADTKA